MEFLDLNADIPNPVAVNGNGGNGAGGGDRIVLEKAKVETRGELESLFSFSAKAILGFGVFRGKKFA